MSKSLKKLIDINRLREFKNKLVGTGSAYVQTGAVDQTVAGTKTFSKPIVGSVTGSSGSCTGNAATATTATTAKSCTGNAATATRATQDAAGNTITTTYATKAENNTKANNSEVVHKSGDETIAGTKTFSNGVLSTADNAFMAQNKGYTVLLRNDGSSTYLLISDKDGVPGTWSDARPLTISNSTGVCRINGNASTATNATNANHAKSADTATKLATARTINGTAFNGTANITTANWGTARNISITDGTNTSTAVSVNGSANVSLNLPATIKANLTGNCSGSSGSCTGNAATATKLAAKRTIALSGAATGTATAFDGSGNITIPVTALAASAIRAHILSMVYPVGSVYISVNDVSPAAFLGGTWEKISQGRVLQGAANGQAAGTEVEAGLPAAYMPAGAFESIGLVNDNWTDQCTTGCFGTRLHHGYTCGSASGHGSDWLLGSYAYSFSNRTITGDCYGKSNTVQPPALLVNIWKRTA